jgi:hypothetical protein
MTSFLWRRPSSTRAWRSASEHLLGFHPSPGGGGLTLLFLPLGGTLLVAGHPCGHKMLHSHALGGYDKKGGGAGLLGRRMNWTTTSCNANDIDLTLEVR